MKQEEKLLGKGFKSHERGLDQILLNIYDPKDKKALSDYTNKFKMIQNVEDGVYNDYQSRFRVYRSLMGEAQAFNVEERLKLSEAGEDLTKVFPEDTESFGRFTEMIPFDGRTIKKGKRQPTYIRKQTW